MIASNRESVLRARQSNVELPHELSVQMTMSAFIRILSASFLSRNWSRSTYVCLWAFPFIWQWFQFDLCNFWLRTICVMRIPSLWLASRPAASWPNFRVWSRRSRREFSRADQLVQCSTESSYSHGFSLSSKRRVFWSAHHSRRSTAHLSAASFYSLCSGTAVLQY